MNFIENIAELMHGNVMAEIGVILILATILAFIVRAFKQPLIPAYILAGLILGPLGLGIIKDPEAIHVLSELGIAFLLFAVGLEINLKKLKDIGLAASLGGLIQVVSVYFVGFFISTKLGFSNFESIVLGIVLAFSSTVIVLKLLSDTEQLDTLHGRIVLGILLIQDLLIILVLSVLASPDNFSPILIITSLLRGAALFLIAFLAGKFVFPGMFKFAARAKELLFLASLMVLFLFAIIAYLLDFSVAIGAFVSGVALATLPYHYDISGRIDPLKTFFATLFFTSLGMQLTTINPDYMLKILWFILAIIVIKPIIIYLIVTLFGYEKRTAFFSGLSLGQVSEFSLILIVTPFIVGAISQEVFSTIILLTILTMILTSYLLEFQYQLYKIFLPLLKAIDKLIPVKKKELLEYAPRNKKIDVVLVGKHRMGTILFDTLTKMRKKIMIVDNNPDIIKSLVDKKIPCIYGNMSNIEVLEKIKTGNLKTIISTVPNGHDNTYLIKYIKDKNPKIRIIVTANHVHEAAWLYNVGADYVILPHVIGGEKVASMLKRSSKSKKYWDNLKKDHIKHLVEE